MKNPVIGITLDEENKNGYSIYPWYAARKNYSESIDLAGGTSIFLPHNISKINEYIKIIDGLVVTGGNFDVDPKHYGQKKRSKKVSTKQNRTDFELEMSKTALKFNIPVLGICGGQQLLNVIFGGTLIQHLPDKIKSKTNHEQINPRNEPSHFIEVIDGTMLQKITKTKKMFVNSAHHQAVDKLGENLKINAVSEDGVIEGIEDPNQKFCLGVQWHPEFLIDKKDIEIFKAFVKSSTT